jgi:hypothetical protein
LTPTFYALQACDVIKTTLQWLRLAWRYWKILKRVMADPAARNYADPALSLRSTDGTDGLAEAFADAIPRHMRAAAGSDAQASFSGTLR